MTTESARIRMTCAMCKQPILGGDDYVIDHYRCSADFHQSLLADVARAMQQRDLLRAALWKLVGAESVAELEQMEMVLRAAPAPAADKAVSIDAIHALIATADDDVQL